MIKIPFETIISKIREKTGLTEEEIDNKITEKLKQLYGLISKEGAAHIVANELGIKLFESVSGRLEIKNIMPGMRNVETVGKVMQIFEAKGFITENRSGKVGSFILGDETGTVRIVCWGSQADNIKDLKEGIIVKIFGGYVRESRIKSVEVHLNDKSKIILSPKGETVGNVKEIKHEIKRKQICELKENEDNVELLGTVVQAFDPRFFEICPECGWRAKQKDEGYKCDQHGEIKPDYSYVLNLFLDDGTDNIRVVFFRNQVEALLNKKKEEILSYKEDLQNFEDAKNGLLGKIIKTTGRVNKNEMFDRLEFIANSVTSNPNPKEEVDRLNKEIELLEKEK